MVAAWPQLHSGPSHSRRCHHPSGRGRQCSANLAMLLAHARAPAANPRRAGRVRSRRCGRPSRNTPPPVRDDATPPPAGESPADKKEGQEGGQSSSQMPRRCETLQNLGALRNNCNATYHFLFILDMGQVRCGAMQPRAGYLSGRSAQSTHVARLLQQDIVFWSFLVSILRSHLRSHLRSEAITSLPPPLGWPSSISAWPG